MKNLEKIRALGLHAIKIPVACEILDGPPEALETLYREAKTAFDRYAVALMEEAITRDEPDGVIRDCYRGLDHLRGVVRKGRF